VYKKWMLALAQDEIAGSDDCHWQQKKRIMGLQGD